MTQNVIRVVGAREHNLKNITVEIPRDKLVVITGLSGSGKSSLAFDTIFAEGQRRYVESLSAYARQFLGQMDKPEVDCHRRALPRRIDRPESHLAQSALDGGHGHRNLRLHAPALRARRHSPLPGLRPRGGQAVGSGNRGSSSRKCPATAACCILAPIVRGRKGTYQAVFEEMRKAGFARVRVDGTVHTLDDEIDLDRYKIHTIEAVVDRLVLRPTESEDDQKTFRSRLTDSVETALKVGEGYLTIQNLSVDPPQDMFFSEHLACPEHGVSLPEIEPRTFSFNTPHGACPDCQGLGSRLEIDPDLLIPDPERSLNEGAIGALEWSGPREQGGYYWQMIEAVAHHYHIDLNAPVSNIPPEKLNLILYGTNGEEVTVRMEGRNGRESTFNTAFEGVIPNLDAPLPRYQFRLHPQQDLRIHDRQALPHLRRQAPAQRGHGRHGQQRQHHRSHRLARQQDPGMGGRTPAGSGAQPTPDGYCRARPQRNLLDAWVSWSTWA